MEGEAYLCDGKVRPRWWVRLLAHYLEGKAYDFFMQKVATDPENWDLHTFFMELFNYCFPIDYQQQMRMKMENIYQGHNQSVSEYIHELQEVFNMVEALTPESKVIKLWNSLWPGIQHTMWKDGLHPDSSTWDEIVAKAEVIEIANKVIDPRDRRSGHQQPNNQPSSSAPRSKSKGQPNQSVSSRATSLTPTNTHHGNTKSNWGNIWWEVYSELLKVIR